MKVELTIDLTKKLPDGVMSALQKNYEQDPESVRGLQSGCSPCWFGWFKRFWWGKGSEEDKRLSMPMFAEVVMR